MISTQNQTQIYVMSNILQQMIIINQNNDFITEIDILPGKNSIPSISMKKMEKIAFSIYFLPWTFFHFHQLFHKSGFQPKTRSNKETGDCLEGYV